MVMPAYAPTPDENLTTLKQSLQKSQAQIDGLTRDRDALTAQVAAFAPVVDDAQKVLAAYTAAFPGLDADARTLAAYDQAKMKLVQCALSDDRRKAVDKVVTDYDTKEVAARKQALDKAAAAATTAQADSDKARADFLEAQSEYASMKALQKSLADKDAAAKKLTAEIDGYDAKKQYELMYVRLKDAFEPAANDLTTSLVDLDTFKSELYQAANWINETWKTAQDKKATATAAAATAATAKAAYDAATAGRTAEILKRVAAMPPAPPTPPAAQTTAATTATTTTTTVNTAST
jgi:hypothetical protein